MTAAATRVDDLVAMLDQAPDEVTDGDLERLLSAAVRLYATRAEERADYPPPLSAGQVTATQVVIAVSEMIRAVDLNLFDLMMWYRRPR